MSQPLPLAPNLEHLKNQAKALLKAQRARDPHAGQRLQAQLPRFATATAEEIAAAELQLADAQFVIAREYGFPSWPRLKEYILRVTGPGAGAHRPLETDPTYYEGRAGGMLQVFRDGSREVAAQVKRYHPIYADRGEEEILRAELKLEDALLIVAREHNFESWPKLKRHLEEVVAGETNEPFIEASRAIKAGDTNALQRLLRQDPSLINASGTNGNTLLNLAGYIEAAKILLAAGSDPNIGNRYGFTPLHAAGYGGSVERAELMLKAGASPEVSARGDGGTPLMYALFWGYHECADLLAQYGVYPNNLRAAGGLGRLDLIESFFDANGKLTAEAGLHREFYRPHGGFLAWKPKNTQQEILDEALVYAAKNNRVEALAALVKHGADINGEPYNGTPLHWTCKNERIPAAKWLLEHGADINRKGNVGGVKGITPLHSAMWGGETEIAKFLIDNGANVNIQDDEYQSTPIGWANYFGNDATRDALLEYIGKRENLAARATYRKASPYAKDAMKLPVADVEAAIPFYVNRMGFHLAWQGTSPKSAGLMRDTVRIGLEENGGDPSQEGCFFEVDSVEKAFAELKARGLELKDGNFKTQTYGETVYKVFFVIAPDGLCYCLGEKQG